MDDRIKEIFTCNSCGNFVSEVNISKVYCKCGIIKDSSYNQIKYWDSFKDFLKGEQDE